MDLNELIKKNSEEKEALEKEYANPKPSDFAKLTVKRLTEETKMPFLQIKLTETKPSVFESKAGGTPYLPNDAQLPTDSRGVQMKLLAQINCTDLIPLKEYPHKGILQFWLSEKFPWEEHRVVYYEDIDSTLSEKDIISKLNVPYNNDSFPVNGEYGMKLTLAEESMSRDDDRICRMFCQIYTELSGKYISCPDDGGDNVYDAYEYYVDDAVSSGHKVGGYSSSCQKSPYWCEHYKQGEEVDLNSDDEYLLLFQLDSEYGTYDREKKVWDYLHVMWGDAGAGNFFIKRKDLRNLDFSNVTFKWDCS